MDGRRNRVDSSDSSGEGFSFVVVGEEARRDGEMEVCLEIVH